eukprot:TRINITY_DN1252_c0_g1_i1.p1 TRINITY_DN1252_c0_g1~~TRINITY_DN1252_c0_g1_i1.p1  ORF type:complete len:561 (+),score=225.24 TRINITY_DN1252_c0_g1_i1:350-2032(+)
MQTTTICKIFLVAILIQNVYQINASRSSMTRVRKGIDIDFENSEAINAIWRKSSVDVSDQEVSINIALTQPKAAELEAFFNSVSNPQNENYGKYMTRAELIEMMSVEEEVIGRVSMWLKLNGVDKINVISTRDMINIKAPVSVVEDLLEVKFHLFVDLETKSTVIRSLDAPSVPQFVAADIETIMQVNNFPVPYVLKKYEQKVAGAVNTPKTLRALYQISDVGVGNGVNVSQACAEFQGQKFSDDDLSQFEQMFGIPQQKVRSVHDQNPDDGGNGVEAELDVQYIIGVSQNITTDAWLQSGGSFDLVEFADNVINTGDSPMVWSISYGEAMSSVSVETAKRVNAEFMKLSSLGVSIIFASGDSGVYSRGKLFFKFHPSYPSGLPAVTAVGATNLNSDGTEDTAVDWSGGGFTVEGYFPRSQVATYQDDAVNAYFNSGVKLPPSDKYNKDGTGEPDVSAQGVLFQVVVGGQVQSVGGTSAACPTFAAVISLLNSERAKAGKGPLGYLNHLIYQNPQMFNDIVKGENNDGHEYGFQATKGWDPVTGMGTPNYPEMKKVAMNV